MSQEGMSIGQTINSIFQSGGMTKFYAGLSAGSFRQATYTTTRLGIYNQLNDMWRYFFLNSLVLIRFIPSLTHWVSVTRTMGFLTGLKKFKKKTCFDQ